MYNEYYLQLVNQCFTLRTEYRIVQYSTGVQRPGAKSPKVQTSLLPGLRTMSSNVIRDMCQETHRTQERQGTVSGVTSDKGTTM